jgi:hypothetical protein
MTTNLPQDVIDLVVEHAENGNWPEFDAAIELLRHQLADATRKLEEARKMEEIPNRSQIMNLAKISGFYVEADNPTNEYGVTWYSGTTTTIQNFAVNLLKLASSGNTPAEAIDQAIEQGKGGDDADRTKR